MLTDRRSRCPTRRPHIGTRHIPLQPNDEFRWCLPMPLVPSFWLRPPGPVLRWASGSAFLSGYGRSVAVSAAPIGTLMKFCLATAQRCSQDFCLLPLPIGPGRLPVSGIPLAILFGLWCAGRVLIIAPDMLGVGTSLAIEASFLPLLLVICAWEVIAAQDRAPQRGVTEAWPPRISGLAGLISARVLPAG